MTTQASPGLNVPSPYGTLPGMPPNMSVAAAISAGLIPTNVLCTNFGTRDSRPGRSVLESLSDAGKNGTGLSYVADGGSANSSACGSGSPTAAAGGDNQAMQSAGESTVIPPNAPVTIPTIPAAPVFQG
jgi:hypothetical protein